MPASNTAQSNTKDGFERSKSKTVGLWNTIHDLNHITADSFLGKTSYIQYNSMCFVAGILSYVLPANIYFIHQAFPSSMPGCKVPLLLMSSHMRFFFTLTSVCIKRESLHFMLDINKFYHL